MERCTFCGREEENVNTRYVQGYEILETCTTCEDEIIED